MSKGEKILDEKKKKKNYDRGKIATWVDGFSHMLPSMPKGEIVGIVAHVLSLMSTYAFQFRFQVKQVC
jgi:hypothetical protein